MINLNRNEAKNGRLKKTEFFNHNQKLSNCGQIFYKLILGWVELIDAKVIYLLNLYGRQAVWRKLNLLQKPIKMHF